MKGKEDATSIILVKVVRKYPCLWNFTLPEYSKKEITDVAWQAVSSEMKTSISNCRRRWLNIRNRYIQTERKKARGELEAPYYLGEFLDFLDPLARISVDGNRSFLYSLVPYLREMTGKQNRNFRQKVIALIDEVFENDDIPVEGSQDVPPVIN